MCNIALNCCLLFFLAKYGVLINLKECDFHIYHVSWLSAKLFDIGIMIPLCITSLVVILIYIAQLGQQYDIMSNHVYCYDFENLLETCRL